jgi:TPR repeat protein
MEKMSKYTDYAKESDVQAAIFEWAALNGRKHPELALMYHCPSGGSRHKAEAARLKMQGVIPGVPDFFLPAAKRV